MRNNDWLVIEGDSDIKGENFVNVLCLTPESCYRLDRLKKSYIAVHEYYIPRTECENDAYFNQQLSWINDIDRLFEEHLPLCGREKIRPAYAHYYRLKFFFDTLVFYSLQFNNFMRARRPSAILYQGTENCPRQSIYGGFSEQRRFIGPLLSQICAEKGIPFRYIGQLSDAGCRKRKNSPLVWLRAITKAAHGKALYRFFKYQKFRRPLRAGKDAGLSVLFLHAGVYAIDAVIAELLKEGKSVLLKEGRHIFRIHTAIERLEFDLESYQQDLVNDLELRQGCCRVFDDFTSKGGFIQWLNEQCNAAVGPVVLPYLKDFIENVCYANLRECVALKKYFMDKKVDFVLARSTSEPESISCLLAASTEKRRVCLQHGCFSVMSRNFQISEVGLSDYFFAMHDGEEKYMRSVSENVFSGSCRVFQASHHLRRLKDRSRESPLDTVLYIPVKLFPAFYSYEDGIYLATWYYFFQKHLIDLFSSKPGFMFIFKYALGQDWAADSIVRYIREKKAPNISVTSAPTEQVLPSAGRVILDFPSTGFYEAIISGAATLCVYHKQLKIRDDASDLFGNSLRSFANKEEAAALIEVFLSSDASQYRKTLLLRDSGVGRTLEQIKVGYEKDSAVYVAH